MLHAHRIGGALLTRFSVDALGDLKRLNLNRGQAERLTGEIMGIIREFPEEELNKPLSDLYLMGYELQRNTFFEKKETSEEKEEE